MEWISVDEKMPEYEKEVLLHISLQDNNGIESPVIITGYLTKDDDGATWAVGNNYLLWDYDYNLGFSMDDVTHWAEIEPPKD